MKRHRRGFTVVELMVVVAMVAVLAAIAAPGFGALLLNQRLAASARRFASALSLARVEAIQRGREVQIVGLRDGDWAQGWSVVAEPDVSGTADPGASANAVSSAILRRFDALPAGVQVDGTLGDGFAQGLRYDGNGFPRRIDNGGFGAGCLTFRAETGRRASVVVSATGRVRICNPDAHGDCGVGACGKARA